MENKNPILTIDVQGYGPMVVELYPDKAPNTVKNFIQLAKTGYWEGSIFHRVIKNFMIQGGEGKTRAREIKGEFRINGVPNDLLHARGVISMARTQVPNSASSQFFIMHKNSPHLDGSYAAFGMMISGFETLDAIASVPTGGMDRPLKSVVIAKVTIDTKGIDYGMPEYVR